KPLRGWNLDAVTLNNYLQIIKAPAHDDVDLDFAPHLSRGEFERIQKRKYWLSILINDPHDAAQAHQLSRSRHAKRTTAFGLMQTVILHDRLLPAKIVPMKRNLLRWSAVLIMLAGLPALSSAQNSKRLTVPGINNFWFVDKTVSTGGSITS